MAKAERTEQRFESFITVQINLANFDAASQQEADAQAQARLLEYLQARGVEIYKRTPHGEVKVDANEQPLVKDRAALLEALADVETEQIFNVVGQRRAEEAKRQVHKQVMERETRRK